MEIAALKKQRILFVILVVGLLVVFAGKGRLLPNAQRLGNSNVTQPTSAPLAATTPDVQGTETTPKTAATTYNPTATAATDSENVVNALTGSSACVVEKIVPSNQRLPNSGNYVVTAKIILPKWLNAITPDESVQDRLAVTSPSLRDELTNADPNLLFTSHYNLSGKLKSSAGEVIVPVRSNGIVSQIINFKDIINSSTDLPPEAIAPLQKSLATTQEQENSSSTLQSTFKQVSSDISDIIRGLLTGSSEIVYDTDYCSDYKQITSVYRGKADTDVVETIIPKEFASSDISDLALPGYNKALATAYREIKLLSTPRAYVNQAIMLRNRMGIEVQVEKTVRGTPQANEIYSDYAKLEAKSKDPVFEAPAYTGSDPILKKEIYSLKFPFGGNILLVNKYIDYLEYNFTDLVDQQQQAYTQTLGKWLQEFCTYNATNNGSAIGLNNCPNGKFNFSIAIGNESPKPAMDSLTSFLRNDLNMLNCSDLDSAAQIIDASNASADEKAKAKQLLTEKDCIGTPGVDRDLLQEYLCKEGELTAEECGNIPEEDDGDLTPDQCQPAVDQGSNPGNLDFVLPLDQDKIRVSQCEGDGSSINYCTAAGVQDPAMCHYHTGLDLGYAGGSAAKNDQKVYAAADGIVVASLRSATGYGNNVLIWHPQLRLWTRYAHLATVSFPEFDARGTSAQPAVASGNMVNVRAGQEIGIMGSTGNSSAVHLHFEILQCLQYRASCFLNPMALFEEYDKGIMQCSSESLPLAISPENDSAQETAPESYTTDNSDTNDTPAQCRPYDNLAPLAGSYKSADCLIARVTDIVNRNLDGNASTGLPWQLLWAITNNESKLRCTPGHVQWRQTLDEMREANPFGTTAGGVSLYRYRDQCNGDPNQLALYTDANEVDEQGRGLSQFMPLSFDAITSNRYWYNTAGSANTQQVMDRCLAELGIDQSQGRERDVDQSGGGEDTFNQFLPEKYSRVRVGDSLCAAAIMLVENSMGRTGGGAYKDINAWTEEDIRTAVRGYAGNTNCDRGYCDYALDKFKFAVDYFKDLDCSVPDEN